MSAVKLRRDGFPTLRAFGRRRDRLASYGGQGDDDYSRKGGPWRDRRRPTCGRGTYAAQGGGEVSGSQSSPGWVAGYAPSGGAVGGSQASPAWTATPGPSGGGVAGSLGTSVTTATWLPQGGSVAGSQSTPAASDVWAPSGGAAAGSGAAFPVTATPAPQGRAPWRAARPARRLWPDLCRKAGPVAGSDASLATLRDSRAARRSRRAGSQAAPSSTYAPGPSGGVVGGSDASLGRPLHAVAFRGSCRGQQRSLR